MITPTTKPHKKKFPVRCFAVDQAVTGGSQQKRNRVSLSDIIVVRCREPVHDIPEYTGQIKQETQHNVQHIGKILYKYTIVKKKTTASKNQNN